MKRWYLIGLAAVLCAPALSSAQSVRRPHWKMYGYDQAVARAEDWPDSQPMFFYYLNSEIARLSDGHLLVATQDVGADALKKIDAANQAAIRRRAARRIVSGFEPPLAHLIASLEQTREIAALNEKLPDPHQATKRPPTVYEIDCAGRTLRVRQAAPTDASERCTHCSPWQDAPPDTKRGALVTQACAAAAS